MLMTSDYKLGLSAMIRDDAHKHTGGSQLDFIRETKQKLVDRVNEVLIAIGEEPTAGTDARFHSSSHHIDGRSYFSLMLPVTEDVFKRASEL